MMIRKFSLVALSALAILGLAHAMGCGSPAEESSPASADETWAALRACQLDDGTVEHDALLRACDPQDTKKTTICHIPPGNPANAHTLCIGNPAVAHHLKNHGDHLGPCAQEPPCTPPPGGTGGSTPEGTGGSCSCDVPGTGGVTIIIP